MKKLSLILLVAVLTIGLVGNAFAEAPAPGGPFSTAFTIQNTSGGAANCSFILYDSTGVGKYTSANIAMATDASYFMYVPSLSSVDSGSYSGVVSCDAPVAAIVNFSSDVSAASHAGIGAAASTWYAPVVYDNYWTFYTNFYVQNATGSPVDITVTYYDPATGGVLTTETATAVPAYATHIFQQEGNATLANNVSYSATITATGNIAAIVNIYGKGNSLGQVYSYNAFTSGSKKAYVPQLMNNFYGCNTNLTIQNISAVAATVTVAYGNGAVSNAVIQPYASVAFYTPQVAGYPSGKDSLSGASITSVGGDIVAVVNESDTTNRAATYVGFTTGSSKVFAPIVMKEYFGYNTSIACQNIGSTDTVLTLRYTAGGLLHTVVSGTLTEGQTTLFYQPSDTSLPSSYNGSATIEASASGQVVCVVNENRNQGAYNTTVWDQLLAYNGINQ